MQNRSIVTWLQRLSQKLTLGDRAVHVGICIGRDRVAMVAVTQGQVQVRAAHVAVADNAKMLRAELKSFVAKHNLRGKPTTLTLPSTDFDLHQIERPDVPEAELAQALRWKLKDVVDYPVTRAVVDVFPSAPDRHGAQRSVYAASADQNQLKPSVESIKAAGLKLERIDIAVLAIRNLALALQNTEETIGVLQITTDRSLLYIYHQETFYLYRIINFKATQLELEDSEQRADVADQVALEIQRTMDYYDSHYGRAPVRHLYFLHDADQTRWLANGVGEQLGINTDILDHPLWTQKHPDTHTQGFHSLLPLALGGALG